MTRHDLVVGRLAFDGAVASLQARSDASVAGPLGLGHAIPDEDGRVTTWRVPALRVEPLDAASPGGRQQRTAMSGQPRAAVFLVQFGQGRPPASAAGWQHWLVATAPAYRLLCPDRDPAVVALWIDAAGHAAAAVRLERQWHPMALLSLPGGGMLTLDLGREPAGTLPSPHPDSLDTGRYSRLAGALGARTLARWQRSTFAVAGTGNTGSVLAHTLARGGASVVLLDPDRLQDHNLGGDVLPVHAGLSKSDAVARMVQPVLRPGAFADARLLDIGDRACGLVLAGCDALISCVDDDRARLWAAAWASAMMLPHLDIGVAARLQGDVGADVRLVIPEPGGRCLACLGGFANLARLPTRALDDQREDPVDFRRQRAGSLRTWAQMAAHLGLRQLELLYTGALRHSIFLRLREDESGRLRVDDLSTPARPGCGVCGRLFGHGRTGVGRDLVYAIARGLGAVPPETR
ncbi:MAG: hypothetical protein A3E25_20925 [Burkholderiales bacterium RIFCSPHIGHO2_12_FULL_69_20]|nr:MAG: hypothetical protein A3E25_20925 [Burkholderiales bacterium RIFCSPHIGHO2_12_FULL_69_20]